jgi:hypothetical protein
LSSSLCVSRSPCGPPADIARHLASAGGVTYEHRIADVERIEQLCMIVRVHVVPFED